MSVQAQGIEIKGPQGDRFDEVLTADALELVARLHREFDPIRRELLAARVERQKELDSGATLDFLADTKDVREGDWTIAPEPDALQNRRVEILGRRPKNGHHALNSAPAASWPTSKTPTRRHGQHDRRPVNLAGTRSAARREHEENGKDYKSTTTVATLLVRPGGWPLVERNLLVDAHRWRAVSWTSASTSSQRPRVVERGAGPYFSTCQDGGRTWRPASGTTSSTSPRTTRTAARHDQGDCPDRDVPGAFEMDEILYELRDTRRASTRAAGTTSSRRSSASAPAPSSSCRTARRSR